MANSVDVPSPSDKNEEVAPPTKEAHGPALEPPKRPPSATKRATSNRCHKGDCNERVVKIIGDCRYCMHKFCTRHRLPELHLCSNMQKCRDTSAKRLKNKLLGEKCVAEKV
ncbi:hypothetical protein HDU85_001932 [Gaertneriomyces sp. JEL0708]|nr:hypothetical protein HDU85_001932 [Gaertneriomyces sp. JEL0708]